MPDDSMSYLGRNPCGCVGILVVDATETAADRSRTAEAIADAIRDGLAIERVPTSDIHSGVVHFRPCTDNPACVRAKRVSPKQESLL